MLQAQKSQIIHLYKQHCNELGVDSISDRTMYSILESICASERKIVSGIDEFVKTAAEGWSNLGKIIQQLSISRENKSELSTILENSKLYLKSKYKSHCGETEETITHCTVFGLRQPNSPFY